MTVIFKWDQEGSIWQCNYKWTISESVNIASLILIACLSMVPFNWYNVYRRKKYRNCLCGKIPKIFTGQPWSVKRHCPRAQKIKKWVCWGAVGPQMGKSPGAETRIFWVWAHNGPTAPQWPHFSFFGPGAMPLSGPWLPRNYSRIVSTPFSWSTDWAFYRVFAVTLYRGRWKLSVW